MMTVMPNDSEPGIVYHNDGYGNLVVRDVISAGTPNKCCHSKQKKTRRKSEHSDDEQLFRYICSSIT